MYLLTIYATIGVCFQELLKTQCIRNKRFIIPGHICLLGFNIRFLLFYNIRYIFHPIVNDFCNEWINIIQLYKSNINLKRSNEILELTMNRYQRRPIKFNFVITSSCYNGRKWRKLLGFSRKSFRVINLKLYKLYYWRPFFENWNSFVTKSIILS